MIDDLDMDDDGLDPHSEALIAIQRRLGDLLAVQSLIRLELDKMSRDHRDMIRRLGELERRRGGDPA
ncbi:hypothetical protein [Inquilinus sp. CA228]|uniref:hypothetical protein n=1 Tax=Inquilinus sp. CA228 TaxID=3455609 RepID=UPI003F8D3729